jgi:hypothetical protein
MKLLRCLHPHHNLRCQERSLRLVSCCSKHILLYVLTIQPKHGAIYVR